MDIKQKQDVVMAIYPSNYVLKNVNQKKLFPLSGISKKLTILCKKKENNKFITYKSDRYGFRNKDINWDKEYADFVLLGDSFVHGSCVASNKTIGSQLTKISKDIFNKKVNTINLGFGGNGPLIEYATLKEYAKYIEKKIVLYVFTESNDFINLHQELKDPFLKKYLDDKFQQKLINKQFDIDEINHSVLEQEIKKQQNLGLYNFIKLNNLRTSIRNLLYTKSKLRSFEYSEKLYQSYNQILINLKKLTQNQNAEFYFVYMPYVLRFSSDDYGPNYQIYSRVMSMVKELNIKYIDIQGIVISEHNDPLSIFELRKGQHLNETGYKFVAETIIKEINQTEKEN